MSFIRSDAKETLARWREALFGGAAMALGGWWVLGQSPLLVLPGLAFLVGGVALLWIGVQRARFRRSGHGPGAVRVDEGQIVYFGPLTGGAVALRELSRLSLDRAQYPAHWRLEQPGQPELLIPVNAEGAEDLFDAFTTLPRLRMERLLAALDAKSPPESTLWQKEPAATQQTRLH